MEGVFQQLIFSVYGDYIERFNQYEKSLGPDTDSESDHEVIMDSGFPIGWSPAFKDLDVSKVEIAAGEKL